MKSKTITFEEVEYEIRSFGFFKANRILLGTLMPIFKQVSQTVGTMKEGEQDLGEMVAIIANTLDVEVLEDISKKLLSNIYVDGTLFDANDLDDYELGLDLMQEAVVLNYSSLGKLVGKLMKMLPDELEETKSEQD